MLICSSLSLIYLCHVKMTTSVNLLCGMCLCLSPSIQSLHLFVKLSIQLAKLTGTCCDVHSEHSEVFWCHSPFRGLQELN